MDLTDLLNATTATKAVEAAKKLLKLDAEEALSDETFVAITRQAIFDADQRREQRLREVLSTVPDELKPSATAHLSW